jgi:hypothetical protein
MDNLCLHLKDALLNDNKKSQYGGQIFHLRDQKECTENYGDYYGQITKMPHL